MKRIMKYALALSIGVSTVATSFVSNAIQVEAKVVEKKEFPKSFQRTWYAYNKEAGKYEKVTFYKGGKMSSRSCYSGKCTSSKPTRMKIFYYSDIKNGVWNVKGLYQSAGAGTYYKVGTKTIKGKKYKVLSQYSGAGAWFDRYYYSKKIK